MKLSKCLESIRNAVGGSMDEFVRDRLQYPSSLELCKALSAEQTDAVAIAIYNIEAKEQGMIIGDQTGIGKGRIAAAMIRYAIKQGMRPIFITEKPNLFSDLYRDLVAIGSEDFTPFILNSRDAKTDIKDEDGEVIHKAVSNSEQEAIVESYALPDKYDFIVSTYSQFNSVKTRADKPNFIYHLAKDNILILDESHNSSGSSNTGEYMRKLVQRAKGVVFLSATFAKRPDNLPVYAMKTAISEANLTTESLIKAIKRGGVALQEVLSSQLVAEGQMIRRERSFDGVEVKYIYLDIKQSVIKRFRMG
jgi:superfamily II DNA or RNA helicase